MSDTFKICAIGIFCAIACVVIKSCQSGFVIPTRLVGIIILYSFLAVLISPIITYVSSLMGMAISISHIELMVKAISLAYITQITCDICKECGENTLASGIDTIGKFEILVLALPLVDEIIKMSEELASW